MYRCAPTSPSLRNSSVSPMLFVALGGAVGTLIRDLLLMINTAASLEARRSIRPPDWTHQIPWVLLAINTVGVFVATDLLRHRLRHHDPNDPMRLLLVTGFLGGLTSYSGLFVDLAALWHLTIGGCLFGGRRGHPERPFCGHARLRSTSATNMTLLRDHHRRRRRLCCCATVRVPRSTKSSDESTVGHGCGERTGYRHCRVCRVSTGSDLATRILGQWF